MSYPMRGSQIIRENSLDEPQVILVRTDDTFVLAPLNKVVEAGEAILAGKAEMIVMPSTNLAAPGALSNLIVTQPVGAVVFFRILDNGMLQSHYGVVTDTARRAIAAAINNAGIVSEGIDFKLSEEE